MCFYIIRNSVNLEGPHKKSDLAMIEREFSSGDLRDGKGFLQFVTSFKTEDSIKAQSQYLRDLDRKLSANATLTQVQVHCDTLLATWCKIRGNDISLPEAFYHYLLQSFPLEPEAAKVVRLRGWVAERMTEGSPTLLQPTILLAKINAHADRLGIVEGVGNLHIQTNDRRQKQGQQEKPAWKQQSQHANDCDDCDAKCCTSRKRGGTKACLCKNAKLPLPDDATYGEKQFVSLNRAYNQLHPSADLCKTSVEQMRAVVRKAKKDKPAVLPVDKQSSGAQPDLSQDQMRLFAAWLKKTLMVVSK